MLEHLITMGCFHSRTPSEAVELPELGPNVFVDYQLLSYLKGRVAHQEREINVLEERVEAQIAISNGWRSKYWDLRHLQLSLDARHRD